MRVFLGWLRGERKHCSMVAIPTLEQKDAKRPSRERTSICPRTTTKRAMSRSISTRVLGGSATPPGVLSAASFYGAMRSSGLKPRMPSQARALFIRLTILVLLAGQALADDMGLDTALPEPARPPEPVAAGFEGQHDPPDRPSRLHPRVPPALQQLNERRRVRLERFVCGWRSSLGTIAPTSPLDWLSSTAAIKVGSYSRTTRERLRSSWVVMGHFHRFVQRRWCRSLAARPIASPYWTKKRSRPCWAMR